ncbi:MAG: GNAT family N-acetyltransferase [Lachnospiraceae bacterium]|nr:GNAT family N-acetyltransferase [Lachnospiraceae bacterium]
MIIRDYQKADWDSIERIHDRARKIELCLAGLSDAFLPLRVAAECEGLFDYPGLFVAEREGQVVGFTACTEEELAWLYVDPANMRKGIGRILATHAITMFPGIRYIEVLKGNEPAIALYKSLGFRATGIEKGNMPGNECYSVEVCTFSR